MAWFRRKDKKINSPEKKEIPDGLWEKCPSCEEVLYRPEVDKNFSVCHHCNYHLRVDSELYLKLLLDDNTYDELFNKIESKDFLEFSAKKKYSDQIIDAKNKTGDKSAIKVFRGKMNGHNIILGIMNFKFIAGSMGSVVGEIISRSIDIAGEENIPLILVCASGGARMQESAIALMQMTRSVLAVQELKKAKLPYVVIMTNPTAGGVTASFAGLGDVLIGEPKAIIAFAGRRVIQDTVKEELPEEFQTAEFVKEHGGIDLVVERKYLRSTISTLLSILLKKKEAQAISTTDVATFEETLPKTSKAV